MSAALVWFRRDLRDHDHAALHAALMAHDVVHCAFLFDTDILDALEDRTDRRVAFIHGCVAELDAALRAHGGGLHVLHGSARRLIPELAARLGAQAVYAARDYEPFARERDAQVAQACDKPPCGVARTSASSGANTLPANSSPPPGCRPCRSRRTTTSE